MVFSKRSDVTGKQHRKDKDVFVRRKIRNNRDDTVIGIEYEQNGQQKLAFVDDPEDLNAYEYSVLVTDLDCDLLTLFYHYRDRADCENNFDELKNQWGWGGYTTQDIKSCQLMSRIIALIYNWWNLFVRLAIPEKHHEAITSRPLLLSSIGHLTERSRQKKMRITSTHGEKSVIKKAYSRIQPFFKSLKSSPYQNLTLDCRTSGSTKKSNQELKRSRLDGRRHEKLDQVAMVYI